MRYLLLLIGVIGLAGLALFPPPEQFQSKNPDYDRGFNEGFQLGTARSFETAQKMGAGEFYFDTEENRSSFRWFANPDPPVLQPDPANASASEPDGARSL